MMKELEDEIEEESPNRLDGLTITPLYEALPRSETEGIPADYLEKHFVISSDELNVLEVLCVYQKCNQSVILKQMGELFLYFSQNKLNWNILHGTYNAIVDFHESARFPEGANFLEYFWHLYNNLEAVMNGIANKTAELNVLTQQLEKGQQIGLNYVQIVNQLKQEKQELEDQIAVIKEKFNIKDIAPETPP